MAGVTTKSGLAGVLGTTLAPEVKEQMEAPYKARGFAKLPPCIKRGVAKLVKCFFEQLPKDTKAKKASGGKQVSAAGEWVFQMVGMVIEPRSVEWDGVEVPVYGEMTRLNNGFGISLFDTIDSKGNLRTKSMSLADITNEMKGVAGEQFVKDNVKSNADLEKMAAILQDPKHNLYFGFSTSLKKSRTIRALDGTETETEEGTYEKWHGNRGLEDYQEPEAGGVDDQSGEAKEATATPAVAKEFVESSGSVEDTINEVEQLLATIDAGDPSVEGSEALAATARLTEIAGSIGIPVDDESEFVNLAAWSDAAAMIVDKLQGEEAAAPQEAPPAEAVPTKGSKWRYQLLDGKGQPVKDLRTKQPKPPAEVTVEAVYSKTKTVDLKLPDGKVAKGVAWGSLIS